MADYDKAYAIWKGYRGATELEYTEMNRLISRALMKQIPMKPTLVEDKYYECACFNNLAFKFESPGLPFCLSCGQRIDWSDNE